MKPFVCIFAHPDDESFGPGGSLYTFAQQRDVYIICVTRGDAGISTYVKGKDLGDVRAEEMQKSAKILGIKEIFFLDYADGSLNNDLYHALADKIKPILERLQPDEILTFEERGVSGHLDHIAVSFISTYLFQHLDFIKKIYYFCNPAGFEKFFKDYFIYFPPGYPKSEIDLSIDVSKIWDIKLKAMHQHQSQIDDIKMLLPILESFPREEYFFITRK